MRTSTIIPAYNEEEALADVVDEYLDLSDEIIIVDDGSSDSTPDIASDMNNEFEKVNFIEHSENKGKAYALRTGVKNSTGEILVFTDADMTYPAEYIPEMVKKVEEGADLVLGSRMGEGSENIPFFNRLGNKLFTFLASFIGGTYLEDAQTGMRALRKDMFNELDTEAESLEFETKMTVRASKLGYNIEEVPIEYRERVGDTKLNPLKDGFRMFKSIFTILRQESSPMLKTGMLFSTIFIIAGLYTGGVSIYSTLKTGLVQHEYYPLLSALFFIIAFQTFTSILSGEQIKNRINRLEEKLVNEQES